MNSIEKYHEIIDEHGTWENYLAYIKQINKSKKKKMEVNLKDLCRQKETLKYIASVLREQSILKGLAKKLEKTVDFYDDIERDLELGGECIIELDKPRLEAIEERNKMLQFLNQSDDL
jgi:hypothetical protein